MYDDMVDFSALQGLVLQEIRYLADGDEGNEVLYFITDQGSFAMTHIQDCCEGVAIEDVTGEPQALKGAFIVTAEEAVSDGVEDASDGSGTWTFYRLASHWGDLTIRWFGESNGYYSESVSFYRISSVPDSAVEWTPKPD